MSIININKSLKCTFLIRDEQDEKQTLKEAVIISNRQKFEIDQKIAAERLKKSITSNEVFERNPIYTSFAQKLGILE